MWIRTCNECGESTTKFKRPNPEKELTDSYLNGLCPSCKSSGLDYGKEKQEEEK